ncbi:hypothetical protein [Clostridium nigeriense]|uniref:hypothetical protein n=1 Tax=Clostridium nigeriense TaxID=1805470 RepID=UPI000B16BA1A|nr:hypothetical protein [Clostridium nigeriense]
MLGKILIAISFILILFTFSGGFYPQFNYYFITFIIFILGIHFDLKSSLEDWFKNNK